MPSVTFEPTHTPIDLSKYNREYERGRVRVLDRVIPLALLPSGQRALDLGSGPGYFSEMLALHGWFVTAVDTDPQNVTTASAYGKAIHGNAITVLRTLEPGTFGLVLVLELIEHMPKEQARELLAEVRRVLRPGGTVIVSTPNRHSPEGLGGYYWGEKVRGWGKWNAWDRTHVHIYTAGEAIELVRDAGFSVRGVTGYWYRGHRLRLPLRPSDTWPMNRLGFNVIVRAVRT